MNIPEASVSTPARKGRERTCAQCNAIYRAPRVTSRYCSDRCKKAAHRLPSVLEVGGCRFTPDDLRRILSPYVGQVRMSGAVGLTVPLDHVAAELSLTYRMEGWPVREELKTALAALRIVGFEDTEAIREERQIQHEGASGITFRRRVRRA